jgi:hypothetical protein
MCVHVFEEEINFKKNIFSRGGGVASGNLEYRGVAGN